MITRTSDHIAVEGHVGTWYVIDEGNFELTPDTSRGPETIRAHLFLLEHEEYGDEAACVIVAEDGKLVLDDVWNGLDDLEDARWERVQTHKCALCEKEFLRDDMTFTKDCHGIPFRLVCFDCYDKAMEKGYDGEHYTEADECIEEDY